MFLFRDGLFFLGGFVFIPKRFDFSGSDLFYLEAVCFLFFGFVFFLTRFILPRDHFFYFSASKKIPGPGFLSRDVFFSLGEFISFWEDLFSFGMAYFVLKRLDFLYHFATLVLNQWKKNMFLFRFRKGYKRTGIFF